MEIRVKESSLVLSAELIMLIGRLQEILELTSRAMALLQLQNSILANLHYQLINKIILL